MCDDAYERDDPKHPDWLAGQLERIDTRDKLPE